MHSLIKGINISNRVLQWKLHNRSGVQIYRLFSDKNASASGNNNTKEKEPEIKIDMDFINKKIEADLANAKAGKETELDKTFMNFSAKRQAQERKGGFAVLFTWKFFAVFSTIVGSMLVILFVSWKIKAAELERNRKRAIGRAKIGGEWELINMDGKLEGSKDLLGNWLLIYFGFTNCPDVCPDEIEKQIDVVDILDREESGVKVLPLFISVDPERDTVERVKKYCSEFSPKLRGFTGSKEQVKKVARAFRIYHSEGPKNARNKEDYIVDHTIIMYLIDPDGQFHDYFGQNRRAREIADVIRTKILMYNLAKKREQSWLETFRRYGEEKRAKEKKEGKTGAAGTEKSAVA